jgi:hypothetical protein
MNTMTAQTPMTSQLGVAEASRRLVRLLNDRRSVAQWWVDLATQLDELSVRLMLDSQEVWRGIREQITRDAPHMTSQLRRLDADQEALELELLQVRVFAGEAAGDSDRVRPVSNAVRDLLRRLLRHEERTTQALYDAYGRDLGGECA